MEITPELSSKLDKLEEKYKVIGQDMPSYLDGLLYSNTIKYWEYINLDTLLTLQTSKTDYPDEIIFIVYHQITELYFKLVLHELEQIGNNGKIINENGEDKGWKKELDSVFFTERINRINRYFESLTKSFEIMIDGMEKDQFLRFRMALLPSSGFQAANYRKIEICCTDFINLVNKNKREELKNEQDITKLFEFSYWKQGATELETGKKTLTLKQFETKYSKELIQLATEFQSKNIWRKFTQLSIEDRTNTMLINALKYLDINVNVNWPLVHYKSAVRYLSVDKNDTLATGGTNWQKYLPPRFQKRIFYPELWTEQEKEEWGKSWVEKEIFKQ